MRVETKKDENTGLEYLYIDNKADKAICLLHGYGASMNDLAGLYDTLNLKENYNWHFMNAPLVINMGGMQGRAWFPIDMAALEKAMMSGSFRSFSELYPADFDRSAKSMKQFLTTICAKYHELHLGGFSQGAMLSSHLALSGIENLKSLTLFSGNLIGEDQLHEMGPAKKLVPFFQSHGRQDQVLGLEGAKNLFEALKLNRMPGEFFAFDGAHEIPNSVLIKWNNFLQHPERF